MKCHLLTREEKEKEYKSCINRLFAQSGQIHAVMNRAEALSGQSRAQ